MLYRTQFGVCIRGGSIAKGRHARTLSPCREGAGIARNLFGGCQSRLGSHRLKTPSIYLRQEKSASFSYFVVFGRFEFLTQPLEFLGVHDLTDLGKHFSFFLFLGMMFDVFH